MKFFGKGVQKKLSVSPRKAAIENLKGGENVTGHCGLI